MVTHEESLSQVKNRLATYKEKDIEFNEPHFTQALILREGSRRDIVSNLLNPDNLVYVYTEKGRYGDTIYNLYFKISRSRTMKLPVIFDRWGKKGLYILTYIMRYRSWQSMVRR